MDTVMRETLNVGPDTTPEQVQAQAQEVLKKVEAAIAVENARAGEAPAVVNPYSERFHKLPPAEQKPQPKRRTVVLYPDQRLEAVCPAVDVFDSDIAQLADDLVATARAADAAGLSAIQVGEATRIIVVRAAKNQPEFIVLVNPIVSPSTPATGKRLVEEGCLSFPGVTEKVLRYEQVDVRYQDLSGNEQTMTLTLDDPATGPACQAVQHEAEHLDGKLLMNNINAIHRDRVRMHMKQVHRKADKAVELYRQRNMPVSKVQVLLGYAPEA